MEHKKEGIAYEELTYKNGPKKKTLLFSLRICGACQKPPRCYASPRSRRQILMKPSFFGTQLEKGRLTLLKFEHDDSS